MDEPSFTQPVMYDLIDAKRSVRKIYTEALIGRGDITVEEAEQALRDYQGQLERVFAETRDVSSAPVDERPSDADPRSRTPRRAITTEVLKRIGESQITVPDGFTVHPRLLPQLQKRAQMVSDGGIDWAMAETIAFGSLLIDGRPIRLAGQDSRRGTFGQRHAVLVDRRTAEEYTPLAHLAEDQAPFYVYDSLLSEYAAMGFEYGYSVARPEALVLWEAQFGDFANGAQSIVDEFISAGEAKWGQRSSVVLLLPHGYEGQGPDHSSARIERYLALSAEDNWSVADAVDPGELLPPAAPAGAVRPVQAARRLHAEVDAAAAGGDFGAGRLHHRHVPAGDGRPAQPGRRPASAASCSAPARSSTTWTRRARRPGASDVAILRIEQLYPLPADELREALSAYDGADDIVWVQEEPANQGAWPYIALNVPETLEGDRKLRRVSRPASASPAAGSHTTHEAEQQEAARRDVFSEADVYFTDRGIEELEQRRGEETVSLGWLAAQLQTFVDLNPEFETRDRAPRDLARPPRRRPRRRLTVGPRKDLRMQVGEIRVDAVIDGIARAVPSEAYRWGVGEGSGRGLDDADWEPHRQFLADDGMLEMAMGGFLVRTGERIVLVDAGIGVFNRGVFTGGAMLDNLQALGVGPDDVTDVVFTHLHFDHTGWATVDGAASLPQRHLPLRRGRLGALRSRRRAGDAQAVADRDAAGDVGRRWHAVAGCRRTPGTRSHTGQCGAGAVVRRGTRRTAR